MAKRGGMSSGVPETGALEVPKDAGPAPQGIVARWKMELDLCDDVEKDWRCDAQEAIRVYRNDGRVLDATWRNRMGRFNILWANVETLKPAVYAKLPKPVVSRRFKDDDPVAREAGKILERALIYCQDAYDFDGILRQSTNDMLLPGRAQVWARYKPLMAEDGTVAYESVEADHVDWRDFKHGPGRTWDEVTWVARKHSLNKTQLKEQFGAVGDDVPLDETPRKWKDNEPDDEYGIIDTFKRGCVYEIWNKEDRKVYWIAPSYGERALRVDDDPLRLEGFFPCPKPAYSIETTDSLTPITEYSLYADQARELDRVTGRISRIIEAVRARGVYDTTIAEMSELFKADDNEFIPAQNVSTLMERGGLDKAIWSLPLGEYGKILTGLYEQRTQIKQIIYEITGLSDIIRGVSLASETATAANIKDKYGSLRIQSRQQELQRFARDVLRIKAEIIAEHFSPETLQMMTGVQVTPEIMALLRNDKLRGFRIDIETDSTISLDENEEKEQVVEFLTAFGQVVSQVGPAVAEGYMPMEVAKQVLMFAMRRFRAGRDIEAAIEMIDANARPSEGQQSAEAQAEQMAAQVEQQRAQIEQMRLQADQQEAAAKLQLEQAEAQATAQLDAAKLQSDQAIAQLKSQTELQKAQMEIESRERIEIAKIQNQRELEQMKLEAQANDEVEQVRHEIQLAMKDAQVSGKASADGQQQKQQSDQTQQILAAMLERLSAPKKVIRDNSGRISGVETVA